MNYHPTVEKITNLLKTNNYWFETFEHEEVKTSEEAAKTRPGYTLHQGAKAIILKLYPKSGEESFAMFVFPADLKMDSKKIQEHLNLKNTRFANAEEIEKITNGIQIGGIPPFGNLFSLPVYADPSLFENEKIVFNAGDRKFSLAMKPEDYKTLVGPTVTNII